MTPQQLEEIKARCEAATAIRGADLMSRALAKDGLALLDEVEREKAARLKAEADVKRLRQALRAIRDMRVNKQADNIWSAASRCAAIAKAALDEQVSALSPDGGGDE